jgi:hypothetical protein
MSVPLVGRNNKSILEKEEKKKKKKKNKFGNDKQMDR